MNTDHPHSERARAHTNLLRGAFLHTTALLALIYTWPDTTTLLTGILIALHAGAIYTWLPAARHIHSTKTDRSELDVGVENP